MKILYIHQYYKTPNESGGTRSYWITKELIKQQHNVVVISAKNNMKKHVDRVNVDGVDVIYLNVPYSNNMGWLDRFFAFISFMIKSCYYTLKEKDIDLIFATSTPLTVGVPALIGKWFKSIPFIFEVRDLWPEVPIQMGLMKNKIIIKVAVFLEKVIYKNAAHIIALSPGMKKGVSKFVEDKKKISMISNMSKIDEFYPRKITDLDKTKLGIDPLKFNIVYFGAMGLTNGLNYIIDAANLVQNTSNPNLNFVFLGRGGLEKKMKDRVEKDNLKNVLFLGALPMSKVSKIVNACDVSLVTFADIEILKTNSPNKLFDSLSAGKPIIVNSAGWTKDLVEKNKCGLFADPSSPNDLIEKIQLIQNDNDLNSLFSYNARQLAIEKYDKSILAPKIVNIIEKIY